MTRPTFAIFKLLFLSQSLVLLLGNHGATAQVIQKPPHPEVGRDFTRDAELNSDRSVKRYEPEFPGTGREIVGRAQNDGQTQTLSNNSPLQGNIAGSQTKYYQFPKASLSAPKSVATSAIPFPIVGRESQDTANNGGPLELRRRDVETTLYITLNVCSQPISAPLTSNASPGQLSVFVSKSPSNTKPSANNMDTTMIVQGGAGNVTIASGNDVFISVQAPQGSTASGNYTYQIAASIDSYYASVMSQQAPLWIDSGANDALFYTPDFRTATTDNDTIHNWVSDLPLTLLLQNSNDPSLRGLENSMCAFQTTSQAQTSSNITTSVKLDSSGITRQQFYVSKLNASSNYVAVLALNSTASGIGGGGTMFSSASFSTKSDNNCAVIHDLDFCSEVAYAVPTNLTAWNDTKALGRKYDQYAKDSYVPFQKSLQQIPCNTTSSAQYSLARNCTDCARDYKRWLCAVTIPRCQDFTNSAAYLWPRAVGYAFGNSSLTDQFKNDPTFSDTNKTSPLYNTSRNPMIDSDIMPGPYKEVLPCEDLCYHLVQSCPAALQFACPLSGFGLEVSYGRKPQDGMCNSLTFPLKSAAALSRLGKLGFSAIFLASLLLASV